MADHTPTPWHTGSTFNDELVMAFDDNRECIVAELKVDSDLTGDRSDANAAFIVKAVNSHAALVKARDLLDRVLELYFPPSEKQPPLIQEARAALQEAGR